MTPPVVDIVRQVAESKAVQGRVRHDEQGAMEGDGTDSTETSPHGNPVAAGLPGKLISEKERALLAGRQ